MENATTIALSRLIAQSRAMDVTATNVANANTPGYRAERMVFTDFLVRTQSRGQPPGADPLVFTQDRATWRDAQRGPISHTGNPLDLALGADGYFSVQTPNGPRLTRAGHFALSPGGGVVDEQGNALLDSSGKPIQLAPTDTRVTVSGDGTVGSENGQIAKIGVVAPDDPNKLQAEGSRLFATGSATTTTVARPAIIQGAVEESNVQPTTEITRMMTDMREFQFVSQFIQGEADRQQGAIDKIMQKRS